MFCPVVSGAVQLVSVGRALCGPKFGRGGGYGREGNYVRVSRTSFHLFIARVGAMQTLGRVTPALLDVLKILVQSLDDPHGFAIAKAARRPTGSVYPILARLEAAGWVESYWESEHPHEGRPRRRFYRLADPDGLLAARTLITEAYSRPRSRPASQQLRLGARRSTSGS